MVRWVWFVVGLLSCLSGCIFIDESLFSGRGPLREITLSGKGEDKVLLMDISGMLTTSKPTGFFDQPSLPARVKEELTKAEKDSHVKALVLRINTPGGTVTASDILYHEFQEFRRNREIPIVASIMDLGTSGGYYVAMAADHLYAHPSTITGSIGVIMVSMNAEGLLEKVGVHPTAIVSGPQKAMGAPFRPMNDEEREIFQDVIDTFYDQFLGVIEKGRPNLPQEDIRKLADGRIYTAKIAKNHGLIDNIGYLDEAIAWGKKAAKLQEAQVVTYVRGGGSHQNIYSRFAPPEIGSTGFPEVDANSLLSLLSGGTPQMLYMWMP